MLVAHFTQYPLIILSICTCVLFQISIQLTCSIRRRSLSYRGSVGSDAPPGPPYWQTCCPDISVRRLLDFGNTLDPLHKLKKENQRI